MNIQTRRAIERRLADQSAGDIFFIGAYCYKVDCDRILRRLQEWGRTPITDFELFARFDIETRKII